MCIRDRVSADRKTVQSAHLPYPGTPDYTYPGGLRIKEINNYDSNDELLTRKHYYLSLIHICLHADRTNHPQPQPAGRLLTAGRENETSAYAVILPNPVGRRELT